MNSIASRNSKRGSALVGVVIIAIIISTLVGSYFQASLLEYRLSARNLDLHSALNLAEAGLEEGIRAVNTSDFSSWTNVSGGGFFASFSSITFIDGREGRIRVYVDQSDPKQPVLVSEGSVVSDSGDEVSKQLRVDLEVRSNFLNGMTARNLVTFNGSNNSVDSYDSTVFPGVYSVADGNANDEGTVASNAVSNGNVAINNGDVLGYVATGGGDPDVGATGSILGEDSLDVGYPYAASVIDNVDWTRVSSDFFVDLPSPVEPYVYSAASSGLTTGGTTTLGSAGMSTEYGASSLSLKANDNMTIRGDVTLVVENGLSMKGNSRITIEKDATLNLHIKGALDIAGNGAVNEDKQPESFMIYATGGAGQSVKLSGNAQFFGVLYAPDADVRLNGGGAAGQFSGALIGNNITLNGGIEFHYDENLKNLGSDGLYKMKFWRELKEEGERLNFADTAALAASVAAY